MWSPHDKCGSRQVKTKAGTFRRPGTAALQAVVGHPAVVCIDCAGGRPSPAAETQADAEATPRGPGRGGFWPRCVGTPVAAASGSFRFGISAAGDGRPPGGCEEPSGCVHEWRWRAAVPGRRDSSRCECDAPRTRPWWVLAALSWDTRAGCVGAISLRYLGGRGRPPSRRLWDTRRWCASIALEGGRPRPPRLKPMRRRRPAGPAVEGVGRVVLGRPWRLRRCHFSSASRRPGTAALQAVVGHPAVVCIDCAGGRPSPAAETQADAEATPRGPGRGRDWPRCVGTPVPAASVLFRFGISAAGDGRPQAVVGHPAVVCIDCAGGRPSPAAETRADADATPRGPGRGGGWPRCVGTPVPAASVLFRFGISAAGDGRPPGGCGTHGGGVHRLRWRAAVPGRRDSSRCGGDAPRTRPWWGLAALSWDTRAGCVGAISLRYLGGRGRPPSRRLWDTRRWCASIALEGGRPRPPRLKPMRRRRPADPAVAGFGRVVLGRPCRLRRCHFSSASRRPGTAALQAVVRNPAVVCIDCAGGRPSPAAETQADADATPRGPGRGGGWPRSVGLAVSAASVSFLFGISAAGDGRPPGGCEEPGGCVHRIALEGGRPRPPRLKPMRRRRPADPAVEGVGRVELGHPCRLRRCYFALASRRPGTAALQAVVGHPAVVCIDCAGGRPSPAAETQADAEATPRVDRRGGGRPATRGEVRQWRWS
jgi:hypothetical protein